MNLKEVLFPSHGISYKRAFVYSCVISTLMFSSAAYFFSSIITPTLTHKLNVNFINATQAEEVVQEVKQAEQQEQAETVAAKQGSSGEKGGGSGNGGQAGTSSTAKASNTQTVNAPAVGGDVSQVQASPIGTAGSNGQVGDPNTGVGNGSGSGSGDGDNSGSGAGDGQGSGTGDGGSGNGGGTIDFSGYHASVQAAASGNYPPQALQRNIQGTVIIGVTFGVDGSVISAEVVGSSGSAILDKAAVRAAYHGTADNSTGTTQYRELPVVYRL